MSTSRTPPPIVKGRGGVSVSPRSLASQIPQPKIPSEDQRAGNYKTKTATFFTKPGVIAVLHAADSAWTKVTMLLETAGPVVVSTSEQFNVTSGDGIRLQPNLERQITIAKGNRLYILSTTVNRVSYVIEPFPWLEQIMGSIINGIGALGRFLRPGRFAVTYPQPTAAGSVLAYQDVFRLKTLLSSMGDVYEIDAGCEALCLGPESDIQNVKIVYNDPTMPNGMQSAIVSPERSFVARLDPRLNQPYPNSGGKLGRILISPADVYDPSNQPSGFDLNNDVLNYIRPSLDIMAYFAEPPSLDPGRSDRTYRWSAIRKPANGAGNEVWEIFPFWGRKYACIDLFNLNSNAISTELRGFTFPYEYQSFSETVIAAPAVLAAAPGKRRIIVRASVDGAFDMLGLRYVLTTSQNDVFIQTNIITSDVAL